MDFLFRSFACALMLTFTFFAADGQGPQKAPHDSPPLAFLGEFSNMRITEEHAYGVSVRLWREVGPLIGLLVFAEGLAADLPAGQLEDVSHDPKTGRLFFRARLTTGLHSCREHSELPARDLFEFRGTLGAATLTGTLARRDALHPGNAGTSERIVLRRKGPSAATYFDARTRAEWDRQVKEILAARGPKW